MKTICIMCPVGCSLNVYEKNGEVIVEGNSCPRGEAYGKTEFVNPSRVVTTTKRSGAFSYSLKTDKPVPKTMIFKVMEKIKKTPLKELDVGDVFIKNILKTGANIVVTGKLTI